MHSDLAHFTFGVEFEVILPASIRSHDSAARAVANASGLSVVAEIDRNAQPIGWKVVGDISVNGHGAGYGAEFVSPKLQGQDGLDQVAKICAAFGALGITVNTTCGFHVHVGGFAPELPFFKNIVKLYSRYESVIDALHPASRRGTTNRYCRSLAAVDFSFVDSARSLDSVIQAQTGLPSHNYGRRFWKLNLAAYAKHRTVEFRQHAGTVDATKAIAWIKICLRMVLAAQAGKTGVVRAASGAISFEHLPAGKTRRVAEMVSRPEGATIAEVIEGTGWSVVSINRHARIAGLDVRAVRERTAGPVRERFFLTTTYTTTTTTTETVEVNLEGFASLLDADADESAFLQARRTALSTRRA